MNAEERHSGVNQGNTAKEVSHAQAEVKMPVCAVLTEKTVTLHKECYDRVIQLLLSLTLERDLYLVALQGILKDYDTIGYQPDCLIAMWSKAKRAVDAGISAKHQPGDQGADLG